MVFPLFIQAQIFEDIKLQINTGTSIPLTATHFEEYWNPGLQLGGGLEFKINDMVIIQWDATFNTFIFKQESWRDKFIKNLLPPDIEPNEFIVTGGNRYIIETSIGTKIIPVKNEHVNPYISVGVGLLNMSTDEIIMGTSGPRFTTETVPFYSVGVGSEFSFWDGFSLFGQATYKYAFTKDENNFNLPLDFSDTFVTQETSLIALEVGIIFDLKK